MTISRKKQFIRFKLCTVLSSEVKAFLAPPLLAQDGNLPLSTYPHCICHLPISHLVAISVTRQTVIICNACVQVTLTLLCNGPKAQECDAGNLDMPKRSCTVLPLREKYVYIEKNIVHMEFSITLGFRRPLEFLEHVLHRNGNYSFCNMGQCFVTIEQYTAMKLRLRTKLASPPSLIRGYHIRQEISDAKWRLLLF